MREKEQPPGAAIADARSTGPTPVDHLLALLIGVGAVAVYVRTLAPDILYSDSAEFQTLAYTLGMAHPTGYPIYLFIARLFGYLPIGTLAWRINLLSAICAAATVSGVFLLNRYVTGSRVAATLAAVALGISYTLWSQAVIAEVYTAGTLWWVMAMLALWHWAQIPQERNGWLFVAAALSSLGLGVHLYDVLMAPAALLFVIWTARPLSTWRRSLGYAAAGTAIGLAVFLLAFFLIDARQSVTSYEYVAQYPSGMAWGVEAEDLSTPLKRLQLALTAPQWQTAMFPGGLAFMGERLASYLGRLLTAEFSLVLIASALIGMVVIWRQARQVAGFLMIAFVTVLFLIINYEPGDKHIFYLPTYLLLTIAAGAGLGWVLGRMKRLFPSDLASVRYGLPLILLLLIGQHFWPSRLQALGQGQASFVQEHYPFPLSDLSEPREIAERVANALPDDAFVLMGWRPLYAVYYVVHVEQGRTGISMVEAAPYRTDGQVTESLIAQIRENLVAGRPVFSDEQYNLRSDFRMQRGSGGLFRLALPGDS